MSISRYAVDTLRNFAAELLLQAGLSADRATIVAEVFVEADLLGFSTHGLNRLSSNLDWLQSGETRTDIEPQVLVDRGAVLNWNANFLPGPYVVSLGVNTLCERARKYGLATLTIRRSQHIACLAAYLRKATQQGLVIQILASTPGDRCVSAFGGSEPLFSPNPFAFGVPTASEPILIDFSLSIVAEGRVARARRAEESLPIACLKDNRGNPSADPADYWSEPRGSIMPIGGLDHGYKGFGLCLWSELMTMALGNYGRADEPAFSEANSVFIQVIDPEAFGSLASFTREAHFLAELCRHSQVKAGDDPVRVPGDRALAFRREQLQKGVVLAPQIIKDLHPWAKTFNVKMPAAL